LTTGKWVSCENQIISMFSCRKEQYYSSPAPPHLARRQWPRPIWNRATSRTSLPGGFMAPHLLLMVPCIGGVSSCQIIIWVLQ
jgi:hypothetical protein